MSRHQYLIVEHRQPGAIKALRAEIANLKAELVRQRTVYQDLERQYGYEVYLNSELIDLLRANQIPFRPTLEHAERKRRGTA